ncbi:MAG: YceI family protein [Flavobacteriaceae bacterium]|jgi:polyisoprenoid-binding protein YceI|nr:YceI family protein [Flavobacteriaceae bacterium]MDP4675144.1 YceI family protein [Flavobacteriaceae bacterium]MDP4754906.1 YceI family protein [Flavobacteriaceae bacterium]MDP4795038.1 YceI family protein [Flavobacteriaceae bacterium]MDP4884939.1 YceI family protein [Flavobacteriaceae bacterium]
MKKGLLIAGMALMFVACGAKKENQEEAAVAVEATANNTVAVKSGESQVLWKGYKVTGQHEGTIALTEGSLSFADQVLTGGSFTVDMTSLVATDLDGEMKGKLEGHLKSDDFFGTETHPTAQLVITQVGVDAAGGYQVTGDLSIKGITQPVSFPMTVAANTATASLKIDRTLYDIRYGSNNFFENLGDKAINNEFDLEVTLQF